MKNQKQNIMGVKPRTSKQIVQAGIALGVGILVLPFIPFKKAKSYKAFKR